jgi:hypothetical protein
MKKILMAGTLLVALVTGCKRNDNFTDPCPIQQTTIAGKYLVTAITYKASSTAAVQDLYATLDACIKDDVYILKKDSTVEIIADSVICPGPPPPGSITVWYVSGDGKKFVLDAEYDISSFDCTDLVVTQKDFSIPGDIRTVTYSKK